MKPLITFSYCLCGVRNGCLLSLLRGPAGMLIPSASGICLPVGVSSIHFRNQFWALLIPSLVSVLLISILIFIKFFFFRLHLPLSFKPTTRDVWFTILCRFGSHQASLLCVCVSPSVSPVCVPPYFPLNSSQLHWFSQKLHPIRYKH